jgi:sigma-B regulation protein RsbU (phosphoserine phosphatase)
MPAVTTDTRFRDRAELLDFLLEVAGATSSTLDLDSLLSSVAEIVREVVPFELFAILLYSEKNRSLRIRYSIGHREEIVRGLAIGVDEGITGAAAATRQPVLVNDVRSDPRYLNAVDAVRSELAVPMLARGRLVGVIDMQSTREDAYTEEDRALLQLIAARVAGAIDNARLYRRVERQNRTLRTLARLSQEFSSILDLDELLAKIGAMVRTLVAFDGFSIMLLDESSMLLRHRFGLRYDQRVNQDHIPLGTGITGAAAELREPIRVENTAEDPRYIASTPGIRSEIAVPLLTKDGVIGVMDLESERVGFFTEEHVQLLTLIAPMIANAVENARLYEELARVKQRMERDLQAARDVQSLLLPRQAPSIPGLEVALRLLPAREISGDIYDFFERDDGQFLVAFGDVSGKSAAAALYGALVAGLLRSHATRRRTPAQLLGLLNEALMERRVENKYVTLALMLWEPSSKQWTLAGAGAFPPLVCRRGKMLAQKLEGVPLGLLRSSAYEDVRFAARPGDVLALYSDGIVDQHNPREEEYGRERLERVLQRTWREPAEAICDAILADLRAFKGAKAVFDDQTLVVMKVNP